MLHQETLSKSVLRPTNLTIDLSAISHNYTVLSRQNRDKKIMFILKANAYGHGSLKIAEHLEALGADYFGVAYLEEGIMLRESGITTPILVMGGIIGDQIPLFIEHKLTITASSIEKLQQIEHAAKQMDQKALAHLKIDTGMERIGMHYYTAEKLLQASLACKHILIEGIFSHLARADEGDEEYSKVQLERFDEVLSFYKKNQLPTPMTHICNSAGMLKFRDRSDDMVRVGILLYGIYPHQYFKEIISLLPAMTWTSRVVFFKVVQPNHPVSYGGTWTASQQTRVITLPIGYGDGYMRAMSNKAHIIVRGQRYRQVGNICMDQFMVNLGPNGTAYNGDEVVLVGKQGDHEISIEDLAEWAGTIPYEIMTNINTRVPRVYKD